MLQISALRIGKKGFERLVIEDPTERERIVRSIHDSVHLGINRTMDMISVKYYWPGMSSDIRLYVSQNLKYVAMKVATIVVVIARFHHVTSARKTITSLRRLLVTYTQFLSGLNSGIKLEWI